MNDVTIRLAGPPDAAELVTMVRALAHDLGTTDGATDEDTVRDDMLADNGPVAVLLAVRAGATVGYVALQRSYESAYGSRGYYISDLYVREAGRKHGTGRALMAAAAAFARRNGAGHVWLIRPAVSEAAGAFYERVADVAVPMVCHAVTRETFTDLADRGEALTADIPMSEAWSLKT